MRPERVLETIDVADVLDESYPQLNGPEIDMPEPIARVWRRERVT